MKKKVVIKVCVNERASNFCCFEVNWCFRVNYCFGVKNRHSKVLRVAGGFPGVQSVAMVGDQDPIEVIGEVDAVDLTTLLRKKVRFAEIVSVGKAKKKDPLPVICPYPRQEIIYFQPESWCWPL